MRLGTHAETSSVAEVVRRAVAICDPDGADEVVTDFPLADEDIALWPYDAGVAT